MLKFLFYIVVISYFVFLLGCKSNNDADFTIQKKELDSLKSIGDENGMRLYTICMLKPGKKILMPQEEFNSIENSHLNYLGSLADAGTIVLLGFYTTGVDPNSFIIFNSGDTTFAKQTMLRSPKIAREILIPQYYNWYGPVVLSKLHSIHQKMMQ